MIIATIAFLAVFGMGFAGCDDGAAVPVDDTATDELAGDEAGDGTEDGTGDGTGGDGTGDGTEDGTGDGTEDGTGDGTGDGDGSGGDGTGGGGDGNGGGDGSVAAGPSTSAAVDDTGGTVTLSDDGGVSLVLVDIPAGALPASVDISIAATANHTADANLVEGTVYEFGPDGTTFSVPIILEITYDPANLGSLDESSLRIFKDVDGVWVFVPGGGLDAANNIAWAPVESFSVYGVKAMASPVTVGGTG